MSVTSALVKGGSIKFLLDEVYAVANSLNPAIVQAMADGLVPEGLPSLVVYRWRPTSFDAPGIYHAVAPSPFEQMDQLRWRDTINLLVRIGVAYGSDSSEMDLLEPYTDIWRQQVDPLLTGPAGSAVRPFNGAAEWAVRTDMRSVEDQFNEVPYACMEFVIQARMDRMINPT
jgi:hypothetical protein